MPPKFFTSRFRALIRSTFHRLALAATLLGATAATAQAANFRMHGDTIYMSGKIAVADPLHLAQMIDRGARAIVLDSMGGLVATASYMAEMIRKARLTTIVRGDCASACTILFYAGARRELTGRLGFHNATDATGTANYVAAIRRYGAPREAVQALIATPAGRITWLR